MSLISLKATNGLKTKQRPKEGQFANIPPELLLFRNYRAVSFTGEAPEAVHYALHHLSGLVIVTDPHPSSLEPKNGLMHSDMVVSPQLELPDVFALLHLANQVSSLLMIEGVIGEEILYEDFTVSFISLSC